jgi:sulfate adenylyltransferase subunit 2
MNKIEEILQEVRKETDSVMLFSSVTGKDSILLTHYCSIIFKKVICVFMYIISDLSFIEKYKKYFQTKYKNIEYIDIPHYALSSYIKYGHYGLKADPKQRQYNLHQLTEFIRGKTSIEWVVFGMKQNDSLNRRLQLQKYENQAICRKTKKVYPLSIFTNQQVLSLIKKNSLPLPVKYNNDRSSGDDISDPDYLSWLYNNYPADLERCFEQFPATKIMFYEQCQKAETI